MANAGGEAGVHAALTAYPKRAMMDTKIIFEISEDEKGHSEISKAFRLYESFKAEVLPLGAAVDPGDVDRIWNRHFNTAEAEDGAAGGAGGGGGGGGMKSGAGGSGGSGGGGIDASLDSIAYRRCDGCGTSELRQNVFKACSRCKNAVYCGVDCQRLHWKGKGEAVASNRMPHKHVCGTAFGTPKRQSWVSAVVFPGDRSVRPYTVWLHGGTTGNRRDACMGDIMNSVLHCVAQELRWSLAERKEDDEQLLVLSLTPEEAIRRGATETAVNLRACTITSPRGAMIHRQLDGAAIIGDAVILRLDPAQRETYVGDYTVGDYMLRYGRFSFANMSDGIPVASLPEGKHFGLGMIFGATPEGERAEIQALEMIKALASGGSPDGIGRDLLEKTRSGPTYKDLLKQDRREGEAKKEKSEMRKKKGGKKGRKKG